MNKVRKNPPPRVASQVDPSRSLCASSTPYPLAPTPPAQPLTKPVMSATTSRTMAYARAQTESDSYRLVATRKTKDLNTPNHLTYPEGSSFAASLAPKTISEQYWAVRALVAEVRLSEREEYQMDAQERARLEEQRRQLAVEAAHKFHENRVSRLERLVIGLISAVVLIALVLLFRQQKHTEDKTKKSAFRPHLTIPILSPFTSIVETEESKISFRTTAVFLVILGILTYAMLRHWLHKRQR
ncbi:hypothetical protein DFH11DRAFT_1705988 [Phellopilus nigrolimitatus]|nr:hypothetical protein DFH11DRAFT_1705988 [Phellopilus nigrolimitatus]